MLLDGRCGYLKSASLEASCLSCKISASPSLLCSLGNQSPLVECENVHFQCSATDVNYILGKYHDTDVHGEKVEITNAKCCMLNKCRDYVTDSTMAMIESEGLKCT